MIQNAKAAAAEANETAARVEDTLSTMKKNLDEWKDQYGDLRNEDLNQAVQDARKSGECCAARAESGMDRHPQRAPCFWKLCFAGPGQE